VTVARSTFICLFAASVLAGLPLAAQNQPQTSGERAQERHREGHSRLGEAFDEGPRERPSKMQGIGSTTFPITTSHPEVQGWFDQGHTLLHSYWFFEAERTFRWAVKLDPKAPMPYWGLMRSASGPRAKSFWQEANARKAAGSPRERAYIDAWGQLHDDGVTVPDRRQAFIRALERIVMTWPDDIEAKALLANEVMGRDRTGTEAMLRQVLAVNPRHPGAHHYRIHNWDDEDGAFALDSNRAYGEIVPGIGHALHMPGHIYAGLGMYHEGAISLDAATRAEIAYMNRQLVFPYNTWNYAHNRNYLSYVQEQLGLPSEAIRGARELLAVPLDPRLNDASRFSPHFQGVAALARALVKYERWDEILEDGSIPWGTSARDRLIRLYAEASARIGKGSVPAARKAVEAHGAFRKELETDAGRAFRQQFEAQDLELRGAFALLTGDVLEGIRLLTEAAPKEMEYRQVYDDPPFHPTIGWSRLGHAYLAHGSPALAVTAFTRALSHVKNDPFTLAGLAEAHHALGQTAQAAEAYGRLLHVWSDAEPGLAVLERVRKVGITAEPVDRSPATQRSYRRTTLDQYGPAIWRPYTAPQLTVTDPQGGRITLEQFRGKNVILVFYLGAGCAHCVLQVRALSERAAEWSALDAEVVAVSQDTPQANAASLAKGPLHLRLASDTDHANARRFKSYDDFEEMGIHSTILIDREGKVHWASHGGAPFTDYAFLATQLRRMNERMKGAPGTSAAAR
jgi:peroxiredoxin